MSNEKKWLPFTQEQLDAVMADIITRSKNLMSLKGGEYARGSDRLDNFRRNAAVLNTTPELVWGVYAAKHWDAINTYIGDITEGKVRERSEPIEGRAHDMINYLILFCALVKAREGTAGDFSLMLNPDKILYNRNVHIYLLEEGTYLNKITGAQTLSKDMKISPGVIVEVADNIHKVKM